MSKHAFTKSDLSLIEGSYVPIGVYQFIDKHVVTLAVSEGFCSLFGYKHDEMRQVMDNDMYRNIHPDDVARISDAAFRFATQGGSYNVVYRAKADGGYRIIHAQGQHVFTEEGTRLAVIWYMDEGSYDSEADDFDSSLHRAVNELLHEETLYQATYYDELTGLPNMSWFFELAEATRAELLENAKLPAFLFLNFNGLKYFNGKFGFAEGNALLQAFSKLITRHFGGDVCSRFAQDHFVVITDAENLEERLRVMLDECEGINDGKNLPVRVGIYLDKDSSISISDACDRAKYASEVNREEYRSGFRFFDDTMLASIEWRPYVIDSIDRAIREHWIEVYYQPIVRAATGLVCDEEALARWIDPVYGFLSPADFIPILEGAKLIYKLDLFVVEEVLKKMRKLEAAGLHLVPQSVNLSRSDFDSCDIVEEIRQRVDDAGIPRDKLTIEITESIMGSDFEFMKEQVRRFQALGFKVWMDDFGSGYSSLDVLQGIHFDLIKLDMSFLRRFDEGDESKVILTELIRMAVGLGIDTLAEGVEKEEQVAFLQEVGCNKLQGFFYSRPLSVAQILERYEKGIQIGFEDPRETDYYAAVGRINLYDTTVMAQENAELLQRYFDTLPMAILESGDATLTLTRCNQSYRDYARRIYGINLVDASSRHEFSPDLVDRGLISALEQCDVDGRSIIVDTPAGDEGMMHVFFRRIAANPVSGVTAFVVVVLAITDDPRQSDSVTYAHVAEALSADYVDMYSVDLDTERFAQYSPGADKGGLSIERHGSDFFEQARSDAMLYLHEDDREFFVSSFTKENVLRALDENGAFTIMYRLQMDQDPIYVNMKAVRMTPGGNRVIIGVSNIDAQVKQREALERVREERIAYSRITALSGNYLCIYTVDPETSSYVAYGATPNYEGLGIPLRGDDFFKESMRQSERVLYEEDKAMFRRRFTRDEVLRGAQEQGLYVLNYRLLLDGEIRRMRVKAAIVEEKAGPQLIVGVILVSEQQRRNAGLPPE